MCECCLNQDTVIFPFYKQLHSILCVGAVQCTVIKVPQLVTAVEKLFTNDIHTINVAQYLQGNGTRSLIFVTPL